MREVAFADLPGLAGQEIGVSDWVEVTQERVNQFAEATGDHQWIHVDVERANREIGGPIAHGYLTLTDEGRAIAENIYEKHQLLSKFLIDLGVDEETAIEDACKKLVSVQPKAGGLQMINECTIEIEGEERPACVAETISILYGA